MKRWGMLGIAMLMLAACGREVIYVDKDGKPIVPEDCTPKAVADAGGDVYFSPDPSQSKVSRLGTQAIPGLEYEWSPKAGLSDYRAAQPFVDAPASGKIVYTLTVRSPKCGTEAKDVSSVQLLKEKVRGDGDIPTVVIDGKTYPTGYFPGHKQYYRAQYRDFSYRAGHTAFDPEPEELDYKQYVQRIFRQLCGDCWTQGAATMFETLIAWADKASRFISRQAGIDCSGFGSCGGGQLSVAQYNNPKGAIYEPEYPYVGRTQRCKMPTGPYHESSKSSFYVRDLNWPNLKRALMETGPLEVCGSSNALGSGGWVSKNPGGSVDHCYALVGWFDGVKHGKPAGEYGIIANSWGTSWGDGGYGYYLLAKDGVELDGNVITEAAGLEYKSPCPMPHADAGPDKTIKLIPGHPNAVKIGTPGETGTTYRWSPVNSLSDPNSAQPIAFPSRTQVYEVEATNNCGRVSAKMTLHVLRADESEIQ